MKVEANSAIHAYANSNAVMQGAQTAQAGGVGIVDTSGVSFQKNPEDSFIAQLEQQVQAGDGEIQAKSKTEVLESLVTEKDLAAFKEYSDDFEDEELEVIVTVVEKIKAQLATYCDSYDSGMVDELSPEQLEKISAIAGNAMHVAQKLAESNLPVTEQNITDALSALELVENTGALSEDAIKTCLAGGKELTIENLYLAQHSGTYSDKTSYYAQGNGYYVKAAQGAESDSLTPQIEKMLQQSGISVTETAMAQAQWMVSNRIPLTKQNLLKYQQLQDYVETVADSTAEAEEMALNRIMEALAEGKRPTDARMVGEADIIERSERAVEVLANATDEQVYDLTSRGQEVTIEALARQQGNASVEASYTSISIEMNITYVTARRQLEEVRMQMTIQSSAVMIRNGVNVETASMQELINELREMEDNYYKELLTGNDIEASSANVSLYREITSVTAGIAQSPAELIGTVTFSRTSLSVTQIHEEGVLLEQKYRQANEAYEQVMTRPRSDMGDSIQKAFLNVDAILEDMGYDLTGENQRAMRILGYNSIEITQENIARIKAADMEVQTMLSGLKPSVVLDMIREGYNPLDKTVGEVNAKISQLREETMAEQENYSEFLWNLEHSEGISNEERNAYIGIYRLMHQIEKTDGAVIGAVVEQGADLTMRNLLTGIRSKKHAAMDYKIGETGSVEGTKKNSITSQIEEGFDFLGKLAGRTMGYLAEIDITALPDMEHLLDMSMEEFADAVWQSEGAAGGYEAEQVQMLQQACASEEQVLSHLNSQEQAVTVGNLLAAGRLFGKRGEMFRELADFASEQGEEIERKFLDAMSQAEEAFTDEASAAEAYDSLLKTAAEVVEQGTDAGDITYEQMRNWKLLSHQIRLCDSLSEQKEYHIPLQIGTELTSMHVQFMQEKGSVASVSLTWETAVNGKVAARFTAKGGSMEGYIVTERSETRALFAGNDEMLRSMVEQASGCPVSKVDYVQHEQVDLLRFTQETLYSQDEEEVSSSGLYRTAKAIMGFVAGR